MHFLWAAAISCNSGSIMEKQKPHLAGFTAPKSK